MTTSDIGAAGVAAEHRDEFRASKGAVIFRQGDPGNEMFVVSEGRVRLTIGPEGNEKEVAVLGKGEFFGELSLLSDAPRTATAVAIEDSTLLSIGRDVFKMMVQDDLDIVFRIMNIQGQRLSRTNEPIQELMQRMSRIRIAAHCLRRLLQGGTEPSGTFDLGTLAQELSLSVQSVGATVAGLNRYGAGSLQNGRWVIQGRDELDKLLAALCDLAERRMD